MERRDVGPIDDARHACRRPAHGLMTVGHVVNNGLDGDRPTIGVAFGWETGVAEETQRPVSLFARVRAAVFG